MLALKISAVAICVLGFASSADAADLGVRPSRIGALFDDRPARLPRVVIVEEPPPRGILYTHALKVPGNYGRPTDFEYRNYYGTSPLAIYERLPYACGFVGLC